MRLHMQVSIDDLGRSIGSQPTRFVTGPSVPRADYATRMLAEPRVNLAISTRTGMRDLHAGRPARNDSPTIEITEKERLSHVG